MISPSCTGSQHLDLQGEDSRGHRRSHGVSRLKCHEYIDIATRKCNTYCLSHLSNFQTSEPTISPPLPPNPSLRPLPPKPQLPNPPPPNHQPNPQLSNHRTNPRIQKLRPKSHTPQTLQIPTHKHPFLPLLRAHLSRNHINKFHSILRGAINALRGIRLFLRQRIAYQK